MKRGRQGVLQGRNCNLYATITTPAARSGGVGVPRRLWVGQGIPREAEGVGEARQPRGEPRKQGPQGVVEAGGETVLERLCTCVIVWRR